MTQLIPISIESLEMNPFMRIGKDWMLITAGSLTHFNTMTASWGGMGVLWNRPVCTIYIRPQRFTFQFAQSNSLFTLSFFPSKYKPALTICGTKSGKDCNKIAEAGLTAIETPVGAVTFAEAELMFVCKKLYADDLKQTAFCEPVFDEIYPERDFHRFFIGEVLAVYRKD